MAAAVAKSASCESDTYSDRGQRCVTSAGFGCLLLEHDEAGLSSGPLPDVGNAFFHARYTTLRAVPAQFEDLADGLVSPHGAVSSLFVDGASIVGESVFESTLLDIYDAEVSAVAKVGAVRADPFERAIALEEDWDMFESQALDRSKWIRRAAGLSVLAVAMMLASISSSLRSALKSKLSQPQAAHVYALDELKHSSHPAGLAMVTELGHGGLAVEEPSNTTSSGTVRTCAVEHGDVFGCTPLHRAADRCDADAVRAILERGAYIDERDAWDESPLHFAARAGSSEVCALLLAHGAQVNLLNASDDTPLITAARAGSEGVCRLLLDCGGHVCGMPDAELPPILNILLVERLTGNSSVNVSVRTPRENVFGKHDDIADQEA